jgi:phenylalanine-4-hydroxylase
MSTHDKGVVAPTYTAVDHQTWGKLWDRQNRLVEQVACRAFLEGLPLLELDPVHVPDRDTVSARLQGMVGWKLANAENEYLGRDEWFEHLLHRRFPVTDYIRRPEELNFTPLPDLFHEYFGHLAFFTDQSYADMSERYGQIYEHTSTEEQRAAIQRLWWYSIEFGLIREDDQLKVIGAGLLSSPGELFHALEGPVERVAFDIAQVAETPQATHAYHDRYFILDSTEQLRTIIEEYGVREGLI